MAAAEVEVRHADDADEVAAQDGGAAAGEDEDENEKVNKGELEVKILKGPAHTLREESDTRTVRLATWPMSAAIAVFKPSRQLPSPEVPLGGWTSGRDAPSQFHGLAG